MDKKYFILIEEEMKKQRAYDSIGDWLFDLEENKKNEEDIERNNIMRPYEITKKELEDLTPLILSQNLDNKKESNKFNQQD